MKNSNIDSIMGKYSDTVSKAKANAKKMPLMATYEQRYKGISMSRTVTEPKATLTLDERIKAKAAMSEPKAPVATNQKVSVEIAGSHYLLGTTEDMSEARIRQIASMANSLLTDTKEDNPGLTNYKTAILALIDCCDSLLSEKDLNNNLRVDLMYYKQQDILNKSNQGVEPTPMEKLASTKGKEKHND